ncbi:hypothetical protein [Rhodococcus ruber]|uniref:hypothetical protein n=1 Tax=Rhodococcus TaxID=1827 RepID=UPI00296EDBBE|nr:hypothetical protein [Rhodococcus ruber]
MTARSTSPPLRTAVALVVLYLLGYTLVQCGLTVADGHHHDDVHVSATAQPGAETAPGHAHVDHDSSGLDPHHDQLFLGPRADNAGRPIAVVTVVTVVAVVVTAAIARRHAPTLSRAPPPAPAPARSGRAILDELCISRC